MKSRFGTICMRFRGERPARWAVHVANALLEEFGQSGRGQAYREKLRVRVSFFDELAGRIDLSSDEGFFQRLCFAYALRYPHIPFSMDSLYSDDETGSREYTVAQYEDGKVCMTQYAPRAQHRPNEEYETRQICWEVRDGRFCRVEP